MASDCGQKKARCLIFSVFCLLSSVLFPLSPAQAEGISVQKAEAQFYGDSYQLSADFEIHFNNVVDQALSRGVSLYFNSEFSLTRPRWYWLNEVVAQSEQITRLSYNALSRQYRITRGSLYQNFSNLNDALRIIGHQSATPIEATLLREEEGYLAAMLPKKEGDYIAAVRMRLDVTQLPKPLQVNALATEDWSLDSDWYRWIVRPVATPSATTDESE